MVVNEPPSPVAWDQALLANPHAVADKRRRVKSMFAAIAPSYDLNNHLHSLWMDQAWRRKAVKLADLRITDRVVDVACGTGDLAMKFLSKMSTLWMDDEQEPHMGQILGIDFTFEMLPIARRKADRWSAPWDTGEMIAGKTIQFINGDAQALPLPDDCADVVSIAFGIRNVADPATAIAEFHRILRPGGRVIILEFSLPTNPILRTFYNLYFRHVLPRTATLISGDRTGAYKYLPQSVNTFIGREEMTALLDRQGFSQITQHAMTFGICICYRGVKS